MHATGRFLLPASLSKRSAALPLDEKSVDDAGAFEGYASLFHREDLSRDIVMPGAFAQSLRERGSRRQDAVPARRQSADRRVEHAQ